MLEQYSKSFSNIFSYIPAEGGIGAIIALIFIIYRQVKWNKSRKSRENELLKWANSLKKNQSKKS